MIPRTLGSNSHRRRRSPSPGTQKERESFLRCPTRRGCARTALRKDAELHQNRLPLLQGSQSSVFPSAEDSRTVTRGPEICLRGPPDATKHPGTNPPATAAVTWRAYFRERLSSFGGWVRLSSDLVHAPLEVVTRLPNPDRIAPVVSEANLSRLSKPASAVMAPPRMPASRNAKRVVRRKVYRREGTLTRRTFKGFGL